MESIITLPNGREADLDSPAGVNEYLTIVSHPFSKAINHTKNQCTTNQKMSDETKNETIFLLHIYRGVFKHASKEHIQRLPIEEISCWVDFLVWILQIRTKTMFEDVCEDLDERTLDVMIPCLSHENCRKMMEKKRLFKAIADFIAAHKAPNMPNETTAESICYMVNIIILTRRVGNNGELVTTTADEELRKLEACGLLAQFIRCSTVPCRWNEVHGKMMRYAVYHKLQKCKSLLCEKFVVGPCRHVINDILAGKDGHRTYEDNLLTKCLLDIKEIADNTELDVCHNCNKRGSDFIRTCMQCEKVKYCSYECDEADMEKHMKSCVTLQIKKSFKNVNRSVRLSGDKTIGMFAQNNPFSSRKFRVPLNTSPSIEQCFKI